jgi:hypothetical protein
MSRGVSTPAFAVMETLVHLEEVAKLLTQAAEAVPGQFHERRLQRLAKGFESLVEPIQRIASGLDETAKHGSDVDQSAQNSPEGCGDPEEGHC